MATATLSRSPDRRCYLLLNAGDREPVSVTPGRVSLILLANSVEQVQRVGGVVYVIDILADCDESEQSTGTGRTT